MLHKSRVAIRFGAKKPVCLWCGRSGGRLVGVRSRDCQSLPRFLARESFATIHINTRNLHWIIWKNQKKGILNHIIICTKAKTSTGPGTFQKQK